MSCVAIVQTLILRTILPPSIVLTVMDSTHTLVLNVKTLHHWDVHSPMRMVICVLNVLIITPPVFLRESVIWELK